MENDLARYGSCTLEDDGCTSCGDVAVPVRVLTLRDQVAICEDRTGARAEIVTDLVEEALPGDVVLVHAGVAIARIQEEAHP